MTNHLSTILVLVVSYRNNSQLLRFIEQSSIKQGLIDHQLRVIAVANGLTLAEQTDLNNIANPQLDPRLVIHASEANPGYFGGAAFGLALYLRQHPPPDWVIVTNDDIYFALDFFSRLTSLPLPARTGIVAPDICIAGTGVHQNPNLHKRLSRLHLEVSLVLYRFAWLYRVFMKVRAVRKLITHRPQLSSVDTACTIYAPHGSCIIFHSDYFQSGGTLNHPAFLYGEENFVAETCAKHNLKVRYEPNLRVEHHEHSSMNRVPSPLHLKYMYDATRALLQNYYW